MKKRFFATVFVFLFIINLTCAMAVEPRASDYFSYTEVYASVQSDGEILVEIEINATHTMQKVGATDVYIYEQQSDGSYDIVYTYTSDDYSNLMRTNNAFYVGSVTYQGTVGVKYYAKCTLYAKDSSGSEIMHVNSNVVTAVSTAP